MDYSLARNCHVSKYVWAELNDLCYILIKFDAQTFSNVDQVLNNTMTMFVPASLAHFMRDTSL